MRRIAKGEDAAVPFDFAQGKKAAALRISGLTG
jgi:hypothetical protein